MKSIYLKLPHNSKYIMTFSAFLAHPPLILRILALASVFIISAAILIESPDSSALALYRGSSVSFPGNRYVSCICLRHIWAVQVMKVGTQSRSWHLIGSDGPKCFKMGVWVNWFLKLGENSTSSGFLHLPTKEILVMNADNWQIHFKTGAHAGHKICLPGTISGTYCTYDFQNYSIPSYSNRNEIYTHQNACDPGTSFLKPSHCQPIFPSIFDPAQNEIYDSQIVCDLVKKHRAQKNHNRPKRQGGPADPADQNKIETAGPADPADQNKPTTAGTPADTGGGSVNTKHENDWDEDYIAPEDEKYYLSVQTMLNSMEDYILRKAAEITGLTERSRGRSADIPLIDFPVTTLLRLSIDVMKRICTAIPSVALDIAFEAFLLEQKDVHHLKEPYIAYGPYIRIKQALEKCLEKAQPITFFMNDTSSSDSRAEFPQNVTCGHLIPEISTSYSLDKTNRKILRGEDVPEYTSSDPNAHEPIIELTWKGFVNAHNYCFKYFQLYFNDHHTYTVSVMPFFTNKIQDTWYMGINYTDTDFPTVRSSDTLNYATKRIWYGDHFGNLSKLYLDLDHCLSANKKANRNYPWFLNRPPRDPTNEWSRKKRDVPLDHLSPNNVDIHQDIQCNGDHTQKAWEIQKCKRQRTQNFPPPSTTIF